MPIDPAVLYDHPSSAALAETQHSEAKPAGVTERAVTERAAADALFGAAPKQEPYKDVFEADAEERAKAAARAEADRVFGPKAAEPKPEGTEPEASEEERTPEQVAADAKALATELQLEAGPIADKFSTAAAELGLKGDGAKRMADLHAEANASEWARLNETWVETARSEFSSADLAAAHRAARALGDAELAQLFDSPLGNHPAIVRAFVKAARRMSL